MQNVPAGQYFNTVAPADYSFWETLDQVVQEEPEPMPR